MTVRFLCAPMTHRLISICVVPLGEPFLQHWLDNVRFDDDCASTTPSATDSNCIPATSTVPAVTDPVSATNLNGMDGLITPGTIDLSFFSNVGVMDPQVPLTAAVEPTSVAVASTAPPLALPKQPAQKRTKRNPTPESDMEDEDNDHMDGKPLDTTGLSKAQIKRMKNTEAARQSRRRKTERLKTLESQVGDLEESNRNLERDNVVLRNENKNYQSRIQALEKQVEELHGVLLAFGRNALAQQK